MPFFGNKFSPKKTPSRKASSTALDEEHLFESSSGQRLVKLNLGDQEITFENGEWIPESGISGDVHKSNKKLERKIQDLEDENNLLKLKYKIVLNMLTQTTVESHLQERELNKLRNI